MVLERRRRDNSTAPRPSQIVKNCLACQRQISLDSSQIVIWLHASRAAPGEDYSWGLLCKIYIDPNLMQIGGPRYEYVLKANKLNGD